MQIDKQEGYMTDATRPTLTIALWFLSAITLAALFISSGLQGELTSAHIGFAFIIWLSAVIGTITLWRGNTSQSSEEKSKRRRVDAFLNDLSDDDLLELKQRLSDVDSESGVHTIGDDGELRRSR
jgi:hypothetical protein